MLADDASNFIEVKFVFVIEAGFTVRILAEIYNSNLLLQLEGVKEKVLKLNELYPEKYEYLVEAKNKAQVISLYQLIQVHYSKVDTLCKGACFFINDSTKRAIVKLKDNETHSNGAVITVELVGADLGVRYGSSWLSGEYVK